MDYLVSVVFAHAVLIQKICWVIYCSPFYLCPVHFSAVIGASREQTPHLWINRKIVYLFRYMFIYIYRPYKLNNQFAGRASAFFVAGCMPCGHV